MSAPNWANQTIWTGDNLPIMRGMNSASVDLIYLDPPFNSNANYAAPIGSQAAGAEFKDMWTLQDVDIAWLDLIEAKHPALWRVIQASMTNTDKSYLIYMAVRLLEMHRVLKPAGSIFLHCDWHMSHYLRLVMEAIFTRGKYCNEIIWCYTGPGSPGMRQFNRKHDTIHWYSKGEEWIFNADRVRISHVDGGPHTGGFVSDSVGAIDAYASAAYGRKGKIPETWWPQEKGNGLAIAARQKKQYVGYPTQKPIALLQRILKACSNEGDMVLDPFCGCATACIAAEMEYRQWAGIDIAPKAAELVKTRMEKELGLFYEGVHRTDIPQRTDIAPLRPYNHPDNKKDLYGEQSGHCNGCGTHFKAQNLTVDHIIAQTKGGTDHLSNLQLLCGHCNSVKGDRGQEYLLAKLAA